MYKAVRCTHGGMAATIIASLAVQAIAVGTSHALWAVVPHTSHGMLAGEANTFLVA